MTAVKKENSRTAPIGAGEPVYTAQELAAAHKNKFGCSYEMVMAALLYAGKKEAGAAEAGKLVEKFRKREVK